MYIYLIFTVFFSRFTNIFYLNCSLRTHSLRSRRLEVVGARKSGCARGRHAETPVLSCAHNFQAPATQAKTLWRLAPCPWTLILVFFDKYKSDSLSTQIPRCDTHFVQFKEEKLIQLGLFFLERNRNFVCHKDFGRRWIT